MKEDIGRDPEGQFRKIKSLILSLCNIKLEKGVINHESLNTGWLEARRGKLEVRRMTCGDQGR